MTNKKFRVAAMSLATAVAVSAAGPSASAKTYYLDEGSVTVDQDKERGAFSYQGEDKDDCTYVDEDTEDNGQIIIKQKEGTTTDNTVTVNEDVTNKNGERDVDIIIDGVNVDTSKDSSVGGGEEVPPSESKDDNTVIKVGEGSDVNITVKDSNLTTGGNGIDVGANLEGEDEHKDTNLDLTLDDTTINLTENATAGINARDHSDVDIALKGDNIIDGSEAIDTVTKGGEQDISKDNVNIEGIRVGGEGASDSSDASAGAETKLTISGGVTDSKTEEGGSLTIRDTTGGLVMAEGSDVEITDGADVTIENTKTSGSTQAGRGVTQHGDLTISGGSTLTVDGVEDNASAPNHTGIGIASWDDIHVTEDSTLNVKDVTTGIYGHQGSDASLTVKDSTLNITGSSFGIDYEGAGKDKEGNELKSAGDITFDHAEVNIDITPETKDAAGYGIATHGDSNITFENGTKAEIKVDSENPDAGTWGIYNEHGGTGELTVDNSKLDIDANRGIYAGFQKVEIANNSVVTSKNTHQAMYFLGGSDGKGLKLHVTGNSRYHLTGGTQDNWGFQATSSRGHEILVDDNGQLNFDLDNSYTAIGLGKDAKLIVDNGTVLVRGKYNQAGLYAYGDNSTIRIKNNSHVEAASIIRRTRKDACTDKAAHAAGKHTYADTVGQNLIVTGGTLTYDYSADNTLWPVNEQGDILTNFLLTKDSTHANFGALSYKGSTYTYLSDLNKETGKQYLSVWVPAAALEYMLDVDGTHDPEIIGKVLAELKQAGYHFDTAYKSNGDQVVILRDMVVNGQSLNFTKTTDENGSTKLIWGNYEHQEDGAPSAYDRVYGTEYEFEGKKYTIVWGYESKNNPESTSADGVLDAFGPDSSVAVVGDNITGKSSDAYTVTIYGALREVSDPVIPTTPEEPVVPGTPDIPTPPAPDNPVNPPVQDARPTTPTVEQTGVKTPPAPEAPVNPPVQDARPDSGKMIQTGTTGWVADALVRAGGVLLAVGYLLERKRRNLFYKAQH